MIVVARTDPGTGARGLSLLVVERGMPGFERGRKLDKIGMRAQDTAELFFDDVRVPAANVLGRAGRGFLHLANNLPQERLGIAAYAVAAAETALAQTLAYTKERTAFGQAIGGFQHIRFELAEMATETRRHPHLRRPGRRRAQRGPAHRRGCREGQVVGDRRAAQGARPLRPAARRIRLHARDAGGPGAFVDNRVHPIYGGTNEIMKEIIGRDLGV